MTKWRYGYLLSAGVMNIKRQALRLKKKIAWWNMANLITEFSNMEEGQFKTIVETFNERGSSPKIVTIKDLMEVS